MGKWNRKWEKKCDPEKTKDSIDIDDLTQKMTKLYNKQFENPRQIIEFEDIYKPPQPSNIIEGMEDSKKKDAIDDLKTSIVNDAKNVNQNVKKMFNKIPNPIDNLENDLSNAFDGLSNFRDFNMDIGDLFKDVGNPLDDFKGDNFLLDTKKNSKSFKKTIEEISGSMLSLSRIITKIFNTIGNGVQIIKTQIMLSILRSNRFIKQMITGIANALTQDSATKKEIDIFQDQTQKFITILMTWFFVYNWYYIVFFLEEEDNIRSKIDISKLKESHSIIYGLFGPAFRPIEWVNYMIIGAGQKIKDWKTPNAMILFGLFLLFYTLVQMNFHVSILSSFFNAMRGQYGVSTMSLFTIGIVFAYSLHYLFGSSQDGNLELHSYVSRAAENGGGIPGIAVVSFAVFLTFLMYIFWTFLVNLPLGIFLISAYFTAYSFGSVFIYEGLNCFDVIMGITDSIDKIIPDLDEDCELEYEWKKIPKYIYDYLCKIVNYTSMNMFEILIILTLLGGIGTYTKNFQSSIEGKSGALSGLNMKQSFKNLFTWLILINVLIIILISMYIYNKFKVISDIQNINSDNFSMDQTMRSRLSNSNDSPVMKTSKLEKRGISMNKEDEINSKKQFELDALKKNDNNQDLNKPVNPPSNDKPKSTELETGVGSGYVYEPLVTIKEREAKELDAEKMEAKELDAEKMEAEKMEAEKMEAEKMEAEEEAKGLK